MNASHSLVEGQGIQSAMAGEIAEERVCGRDEYGNLSDMPLRQLK